VGWVDGHDPHAHIDPAPGAVAPAQVQVVEPYVHWSSAAHAAPPGVHAPVGCVPGHAVHCVHVHSGVAPPPAAPPQSQTTSP
jgi:hypothetical protein